MTVDVNDVETERLALAGAYYDEACAALAIERREQQRRIVQACVRDEGVFALEAPTGSGKSLGALIGAAARSRVRQQRVAVATYTNVLREQYAVDVERARRAFPDVTFATVAGVGAYACRNRAAERRSQARGAERRGIDAWLRRTAETGDLTLASIGDWRVERWVRADAEECALDVECGEGTGCGVRVARREARRAGVVVTNHALLSVNVEAGGGIIGSFGCVVVDEVHRLEEALRGAGEVTVSERSLSRGRGQLDDGAARRLDALGLTLRGLRPVDETWAGKRSWAGWCVPFSREELQLRAGLCGTDAVEAVRRVEEEQRAHGREVHGGAGLGDDACGECRQWKRDLGRARDLLAELRAVWLWAGVAQAPAQGEQREWVGTVWRSGSPLVGEPRLTLTPVSVVERGRALAESVSTVVCVSATVGCAASPDYALERVGLEARDGTERLPPAFDYPRQMRGRFDRRSGDELLRLGEALEVSGGRALVLCRTHGRKDAVAAALERGAPEGVNVLRQPSQEEAAGRGAVVREFSRDERSVLVGTRSYYEGIDVRGDSLRQVVVLDRPYVTRSPLEQQRSVNLAAAGRSWRSEVEAPLVEMAFEQMCGRLIRSREDFGWVTYLDGSGWDRLWYEQRWDAALRRFGDVACDVVS